MRDWSPERVAEAAGVRLARPATLLADGPPGPARVTIDSRDVRPGDLFVGLPGSRVHGGRYAAAALSVGAWGVLVAQEYARDGVREQPGVLLTSEDPLAGLQALARSWRRALGAQVIAITGSTGKTSTKDLLAAMVAQERRVAATEQNLNTEIGLPLTVLGAPTGTEVLVLEMAMRGAGQIAELTAIAEPDIGVIVNVGPVHLELLGSLEAIAAAKAELLAGLRPGATAVLPAAEPLLDAHRREDLRTVTFGPGGDVARALIHVKEAFAGEGEEPSLPAADLAALTRLEIDGAVTATQAKQVLAELLANGGGDAGAIAREKGFEAMDTSALDTLVGQVIADNADSWASFEGGNDKAMGALVGAAMKASRGKADGKAVTAALRARRPS